MRKKICISSVYNEEETVVDILSRLEKFIDIFVIVNDGSIDTTMEKIMAWKNMVWNKCVYVYSFKKNIGKGKALWNCFCFVKHLMEIGSVSQDDYIVLIDADGQHKPEFIDDVIDHLEKGNYDIVITRRNFSVYPLHKKLGNKFLSLWASIFANFKFHDVECGFRIFKAKLINDFLPYYTGHRYSCEQEMSVILGQLGARINNDYLIKVDTYVSGSKFIDGIYVFLLGVIAYLRVKLRIKNKKFDWKMI